MVQFAELHPKDDAEVVEQIKGVFDALAAAQPAASGSRTLQRKASKCPGRRKVPGAFVIAP
ncbi:UNVERIFIED_ORG: hypothetical protein ABIB21_001798 [Arthrobacter sp. UYEF13]